MPPGRVLLGALGTPRPGVAFTRLPVAQMAELALALTSLPSVPTSADGPSDPSVPITDTEVSAISPNPAIDLEQTSAMQQEEKLPAISKVSLRRFKQFKNIAIDIHPGVTLVAGANNAGKSSLLHALAVWEFCRTATLMERGPDGILPWATQRQGFGLGDDEFSPINVPSLKHLWTNLKTAKTPDDADGYTLGVTCEWGTEAGTKTLGFALALANDRLFIKVSESNIGPGELTPACGYLPPFAGIRAREERVGGAIRRRRIGEGLAGAVLRNLLLDMHQVNAEKRAALKQGRHKISDADLRRLRDEDPWELLQQTLRQVFQAELQIDDFEEEYHSYIKAEVVKGEVDGYKLTRFPHYTARDLMVEGSGFLQWLSVYALAVAPGVSVLMFDEPDAHLHPSLQQRLVTSLAELAKRNKKQVLIATHSSEILRAAAPRFILNIGSGRARYLAEEHQKVGMLAGLGSDYSPRLDRVRQTRRIFFHEGPSDIAILRILADRMGITWPEGWVEWQTSSHHKDRRLLWRAMCDEFGPVVAVSLRDRDEESFATVGERLEDKSYANFEADGFLARKWKRRYIESYLVWPEAIAKAGEQDVDRVREVFAETHALAIGTNFADHSAPHSLLDLRAKEVLATFGVHPIEVAKAMPIDAIAQDVREIFAILQASPERLTVGLE